MSISVLCNNNKYVSAIFNLTGWVELKSAVFWSTYLLEGLQLERKGEMDEPRVPLEDYGNRQRPVDEPRGDEHTPRGAAGEETRKCCGTIRSTPSTCDAAARGTRRRVGPRGGTASPCFLAGVLREPPRQDRRRKPGSWTLLRGSPSPSLQP